MRTYNKIIVPEKIWAYMIIVAVVFSTASKGNDVNATTTDTGSFTTDTGPEADTTGGSVIPDVRSTTEAELNTFQTLSSQDAGNNTSTYNIGDNSGGTNVTTVPSVNVTESSSSNATVPPCHILDEFGTENFFFKYTMALVGELLCVCRGFCVKDMTTPSPEKLQRIRNELEWFLSSSNRWKFITVTPILGSVFLLGLVGNVLTIACLTCWVKKKSSTFLFILSLACSDILLLSISLPVKELEVFSFLDELGGPFCKLAYYMRDFSLISSVLTLTIISFERFYAICHPLKAQFRCSTSRARILIVFTWLISATLSVPTLFIVQAAKSDFTVSTICRPMTDDYNWVRVYHLYELTILYFVPLCIMGTTNTLSCLALYKSAKSAKSMQGDGKSKTTTENGVTKEKSSSTSTTTGGTEKGGDEKGEGTINARIKVMQMLVAMLVVFVLCWGPMLFYQVLKSFEIKPGPSYEDMYRFSVETLAFANSSFNPYFYMGMSSHFRREFRRRFGWICGMKASLPGDSTVATSSTMSTKYTSGVYSTAASGQPRV